MAAAQVHLLASLLQQLNAAEQHVAELAQAQNALAAATQAQILRSSASIANRGGPSAPRPVQSPRAR